MEPEAQRTELHWEGLEGPDTKVVHAEWGTELVLGLRGVTGSAARGPGAGGSKGQMACCQCSFILLQGPLIVLRGRKPWEV